MHWLAHSEPGWQTLHVAGVKLILIDVFLPSFSVPCFATDCLGAAGNVGGVRLHAEGKCVTRVRS